LLTSIGRFQNGGDYFRQKFEAGKRYLIRIINGSSNMHFQWSIDNHEFTVVSADFVAIEPYKTNYLSVGIGQRYAVIVEAKPDVASSDGKYWMRTEWTNDPDCGGEPPRGLNDTLEMSRSGIISYDDAGYGDELPSTSRHDVTIGCHDEPYEKLIPIVPWTVSAPANDVANYTYEGGTDTTNKDTWHGAVYRWSLMDNPMWLNFSDPLLLDVEGATKNPDYAVVDCKPTFLASTKLDD
jgi:FtsP/CotA-like multicopper oxidase with cupredoxin domain